MIVNCSYASSFFPRFIAQLYNHADYVKINYFFSTSRKGPKEARNQARQYPRDFERLVIGALSAVYLVPEAAALKAMRHWTEVQHNMFKK